MRALMRSLAPTCFDDVAALVALYRPGPMAANMHNDFADRKNGRKPVKCLHPHLEEELADTHGLMIYQESMMRVASRFAGYSLEEADNLRKACLPGGTLDAHQGPRLCAHRTSHEHAGSACSDRRHGFVHVPLRADRRRVVGRHQAGLRADYVHGVLHPGHGGASFPRRGRVAGAARDRSRRPRRRGRPHTRSHGGSKVSMAEVELASLLISEGYTPDVRLHQRRAYFCNTDPELVSRFTDRL